MPTRDPDDIGTQTEGQSECDVALRRLNDGKAVLRPRRIDELKCGVDRPEATRSRRADGVTLDRCSVVVPPVSVCCPPVVFKETDAGPVRARQA